MHKLRLAKMVKFLYTNIGRGHPFYLDGIVEVLKQDGRLKFECHDVFEISKDPALSAWKLARWLYKIGSTNSVIGKWYNLIRDRSEYHENSLAMKIMGRDLRKWFSADESPLIVDHPVLVGILKGKKNLLYQHGEVAVPMQAVVKGGEYVFVPVDSCTRPFLQASYRKEQIIVTGLCIEPALVKVAESAYQSRMARILSQEPLTGAFFSSGAEPKPHVEKLVAAVKSVTQSGDRAVVFAHKGGRVDSAFKGGPNANSRAILKLYSTREELDRLTAESFAQFDYLVSPSHERTNWAFGLGLPMFILEPAIGPFSPLNRQALLNAKVAISMDYRTAEEFLWALEHYRTNGDLANLALAGWKKYPISGFRAIADFLINKFAAGE